MGMRAVEGVEFDRLYRQYDGHVRALITDHCRLHQLCIPHDDDPQSPMDNDRSADGMHDRSPLRPGWLSGRPGKECR